MAMRCSLQHLVAHSRRRLTHKQSPLVIANQALTCEHRRVIVSQRLPLPKLLPPYPRLQIPSSPHYSYYISIMDAAAGIVFTGPLSAGNFYVAGPRTGPALFQTNSNTSGDNAALNDTAKRKLTLNILTANAMGLPANTLIAGGLEWVSYSGSFLGFVFGLKEGNYWKFYLNGIGDKISMVWCIF